MMDLYVLFNLCPCKKAQTCHYFAPPTVLREWGVGFCENINQIDLGKWVALYFLNWNASLLWQLNTIVLNRFVFKTSDSIGFIEIWNQINCLQRTSLFPFPQENSSSICDQIYWLFKNFLHTFRRMSTRNKVRLMLNHLDYVVDYWNNWLVAHGWKTLKHEFCLEKMLPGLWGIIKGLLAHWPLLFRL